MRYAYRPRERPEDEEDPPEEDRPLLPDEDLGGGEERTVRPLELLPLLREEGVRCTLRPLELLPLLREEGVRCTLRPLELLPLLREEGVRRTVFRLPVDDEDREPGVCRTVRPLDPLPLLREEGVRSTVRPREPLSPLREEPDVRAALRLPPGAEDREPGVERTVRPLDPLLVAAVRRVSRVLLVAAPVSLRAERPPETAEPLRVLPAEAPPALPISRTLFPPTSPAYPWVLVPRPMVAPRRPHSPSLGRIDPG